MHIHNQPYKTIWYDAITDSVKVINQIVLPFEFKIDDLKTHTDAYYAIKNMVVRGAPLIGVTGAFGLFLFIREKGGKVSEPELRQAAQYLISARPTAINLELVVLNMVNALLAEVNASGLTQNALRLAQQASDFEEKSCEQIGEHGLKLIEELAKRKAGQPVNILTHCNAGWLACIDWGTATAPIYKAHLKGIEVHVWVDETRPRNQGARLTAFELKLAGVKHTVIADNTGGHLMQHGLVDMVIVGSDRTTRNGDVANKIGTYLKALAAADNNVPFYVALPTTSIDIALTDGVKNIPIEERDGLEITTYPTLINGQITYCELMPANTPVANFGFDVTPARLITALITENGICSATENAIMAMLTK